METKSILEVCILGSSYKLPTRYLAEQFSSPFSHHHELTFLTVVLQISIIIVERMASIFRESPINHLPSITTLLVDTRLSFRSTRSS